MGKLTGILDTIAYGVFGITFIDIGVLLSGLDFNVFVIDNSLKVGLSLFSIGYFTIFKIPHTIKMNRLARKEAKLRNQRLQWEIWQLDDKLLDEDDE